jgi:hypothetical protein
MRRKEGRKEKKSVQFVRRGESPAGSVLCKYHHFCKQLGIGERERGRGRQLWRDKRVWIERATSMIFDQKVGGGGIRYLQGM